MTMQRINRQQMRHFPALPSIAALVGVLTLAGLLVGAAPSFADDRTDAQQLVEKARLSFESFTADPNFGVLRDYLKTAKGVYIAPQVLRGAFIFGVSGGSGVLLARDEKVGTWGGPAFYTIGEASFGLQAGADAAEVVMLAMTERGVSKLLSTSVKLGGDVSIAAGPVGAGMRGETAGLSADIVSFARSKGLYAGISFEGAIVATRDGLNKAYYGKAVTPTDILIRREVSNAQAAPLVRSVTEVAGR
ncbi:MAG: lipid-binding SYLF domain-containing protein [Candidatus Methylomirabilaceae bacterium]